MRLTHSYRDLSRYLSLLSDYRSPDYSDNAPQTVRSVYIEAMENTIRRLSLTKEGNRLREKAEESDRRFKR